MAALSNEQKKICTEDPFENHADDTFLLINRRYDKIIKDPVSESEKRLLQESPNETAIMGTFESKNYTFKPVGGGVSGAFLFEIQQISQGFRDRTIEFVTGPASRKSKFIKIYIDALTPKKNPVWVKNTRAFREVRALELLSSYWYHNKIKTGITFIGRKNAKIINFDNVKSLFFCPNEMPLEIGNTTTSLGFALDFFAKFGLNKFQKNKSQADARSVSILPEYTLLLEMPKAPGLPFFNMNPIDCFFFGTVLQLLVVWEHFTEALPKGCHWDLHPNNIFYNKKRQMRNSFEVEMEDNLIYEEYEEEAQRELEQKRSKDREFIVESLEGKNEVSLGGKEKEILQKLFFSESESKSGNTFEKMVETIKEGRRKSTKKITVTCPEVTIIDFDFVTFDYGEMGIITDDHKKKIDSIGGIGYDLANWLTIHLPLNAVATLLSFLQSKKHNFPSHNKVDWCHIICYIAVALCYNFSKIWGKGMDLVMHGMCLSLYKIQAKLKKVRDLRTFLLAVNTAKTKFTHFYTSVGSAASKVKNEIEFDTNFITEGKNILMNEFGDLIDSSLFSLKNLFYLLQGQIPRLQRAFRDAFPQTSNITLENLSDITRRFYLTISQIPERKHLGNITFNFTLDFRVKEEYCLFEGEVGILFDKIGESLKKKFVTWFFSLDRLENKKFFIGSNTRLLSVKLYIRNRTLIVETGKEGFELEILLKNPGQEPEEEPEFKISITNVVFEMNLGSGDSKIKANILTEKQSARSGNKFEIQAQDVSYVLEKGGKNPIDFIQFLIELFQNSIPTIETVLDLAANRLTEEETVFSFIMKNGELDEFFRALTDQIKQSAKTPANLQVLVGKGINQTQINFWGEEEMEPVPKNSDSSKNINGKRYRQENGEIKRWVKKDGAAEGKFEEDYYPFETFLSVICTFPTGLMQAVDVLPVLYVLDKKNTLRRPSDKKKARTFQKLVTYSLLESISENTMKKRTMPVEKTLQKMLEYAKFFFKWDTREKLVIEMKKREDFYEIAKSKLIIDVPPVQDKCEDKEKGVFCDNLLRNLQESVDQTSSGSKRQKYFQGGGDNAFLQSASSYGQQQPLQRFFESKKPRRNPR